MLSSLKMLFIIYTFTYANEQMCGYNVTHRKETRKGKLVVMKDDGMYTRTGVINEGIKLMLFLLLIKS